MWFFILTNTEDTIGVAFAANEFDALSTYREQVENTMKLLGDERYKNSRGIAAIGCVLNPTYKSNWAQA